MLSAPLARFDAMAIKLLLLDAIDLLDALGSGMDAVDALTLVQSRVRDAEWQVEQLKRHIEQQAPGDGGDDGVTELAG